MTIATGPLEREPKIPLKPRSSDSTMGLLSRFRGSPEPHSDPKSTRPTPKSPAATEDPGMNGALEVPRPGNVTVFEFGSVAATADKVTLAGFCPVSDQLEPCRWGILPASSDSGAPQFRVVF